MNEIISDILGWLNVLWTLPARGLVFFGCIATCELIRRSTKNNHIIPWACALTGIIGTFLLADPYDVTLLFRIWIGRNLFFALCSSTAAHYLHWKVLANEKSKWPVIGGLFTGSGNSEPQLFIKGKNAKVEDLGLPGGAGERKV